MYIIIILLVTAAQTKLRLILQHILLLIKIAWKHWTALMEGSLKWFHQEHTDGIKRAASPGIRTSGRLVPEQTGLVTSIDSPVCKGFLNIFVETQHWTWPVSPSPSYSSNCTCSLWLHSCVTQLGPFLMKGRHSGWKSRYFTPSLMTACYSVVAS